MIAHEECCHQSGAGVARGGSQDNGSTGEDTGMVAAWPLHCQWQGGTVAGPGTCLDKHTNKHINIQLGIFHGWQDISGNPSRIIYCYLLYNIQRGSHIKHFLFIMFLFVTFFEPYWTPSPTHNLFFVTDTRWFYLEYDLMSPGSWYTC